MISTNVNLVIYTVYDSLNVKRTAFSVDYFPIFSKPTLSSVLPDDSMFLGSGLIAVSGSESLDSGVAVDLNSGCKTPGS